MDEQTKFKYWKHVLGLFIATLVLNIPTFIYLDNISNAITNFFSIHESKNSVGYLIYAMSIIMNLPLVMHMTKSTLYEIMYVIICIFMAILNPYSFITTPYNSWYIFTFTILLFLVIKSSFTFIQLVLFILLAITANNEILSFIINHLMVF